MVATSDKERPVLLKKNLLLIFSETKDNLMGCKMFGACMIGYSTRVAFPGPV